MVLLGAPKAASACKDLGLPRTSALVLSLLLRYFTGPLIGGACLHLQDPLLCWSSGESCMRGFALLLITGFTGDLEDLYEPWYGALLEE